MSKNKQQQKSKTKQKQISDMSMKKKMSSSCIMQRQNNQSNEQIKYNDSVGKGIINTGPLPQSPIAQIENNA